MTESPQSPMRRRDLLKLIGGVAGSSVMYQAMTALGLAAESTYSGPMALDGSPKGASVLILGAGLAGLVAALELRKAGYKVQVLEYQNRAGGRCWTIRGGDRYTELGGASRPASSTRTSISIPARGAFPRTTTACSTTASGSASALEPFMQVNHNAYCHSKSAFGGKPQRFRHLKADFQGGVAELLAKATSQNKLDEIGLGRRQGDAARGAARTGARSIENYAYKAGPRRAAGAATRRIPAAASNAEPTASEPIAVQGRSCSRARLAASRRRRSVLPPLGDLPAGRRHGHDCQGRSPAKSAT